MLGSRPGDRRTMSVRLMVMRGQIQSYCTATTNPAVISHCQVCQSALSSVIAEAAGPSEAPEAGPARTYGAYSSSGQPQSQTDM